MLLRIFNINFEYYLTGDKFNFCLEFRVIEIPLIVFPLYICTYTTAIHTNIHTTDPNLSLMTFTRGKDFFETLYVNIDLVSYVLKYNIKGLS